MILFTVISLIVILADQVSKQLSLEYLRPVGSVTVIPKIFNFSYVENRGAAWGIFADNRWIFLVLSSAAIIAILVYVIKTKPKSKLELVSLSLILGGGIANMIDRIIRGFVVDMIQAAFIDFPVFNIADSCVCIGCGILIIYILLSMRKKEKDAK